jgi:hypothetical protein
LISIPYENLNAKIGSDKEIRADSASGHAPENQSTTIGYRHQMDVVDTSRSLQSIGVPRALGARRVDRVNDAP